MAPGPALGPGSWSPCHNQGMPEGDSVARTARELHAALAGTVLVGSELRWPSLATRSLVGWATIEVVARGKHLLHRFDSGWTLHSHRRMEGRWQVRPPGPVPRHHQLRAVLTTAEQQALGWQLGMLDLVRTEQEATLVGHLGPDVLGADWNVDEAISRLRAAPDRAVGAALLDQRNLAGLGTIWVSDLLFLAGILPWRRIEQLTDEDLRRTLARARPMMQASVVAVVPNTTGQTRHGRTSWTHGRSGQPCRRCNTLLRVAMSTAVVPTPSGIPGGVSSDGQGDAMARTLFYCPSCQGGLAPGDDGRPQAPLGARPRGPAGRPRR